MNTPQDRYTAGKTTGSSSGTTSGLNAPGVQSGSRDVDVQKQQTREQVGELADTIKTEGKAKVEELKDTARSEGKAKVEEYRSVAANKVDKLADSVKAAASELEGDEDIGQLSRYVSEAAEKIHQFSEGLRTRSGDDLMQDVSRMARENPALFIGGSIAIGFGLARFARAAQPPRQMSHDDSSEHTSPYGDTYRQGSGARSPGTTAGFGSDFDNTKSGGASGGSTGTLTGGTGSTLGTSSSTPSAGGRGSDLSSSSGLSGSSTAGSGLGGSSSGTGSSSVGTSSTGSVTGSPRSTRDMSSDADNGQGRKPS